MLETLYALLFLEGLVQLLLRGSGLTQKCAVFDVLATGGLGVGLGFVDFVA